MDKQEFAQLFNSLTTEQQKALLEAYRAMLNAHNPQKNRLTTSA